MSEENIKKSIGKFEIVEDDSLSTYGTRYTVVDRDTGEVLDNAQGYGYKSEQKAYAAFKYKMKVMEGLAIMEEKGIIKRIKK